MRPRSAAVVRGGSGLGAGRVGMLRAKVPRWAGGGGAQSRHDGGGGDRFARTRRPSPRPRFCVSAPSPAAPPAAAPGLCCTGGAAVTPASYGATRRRRSRSSSISSSNCQSATATGTAAGGRRSEGQPSAHSPPPLPLSARPGSLLGPCRPLETQKSDRGMTAVSPGRGDCRRAPSASGTSRSLGRRRRRHRSSRELTPGCARWCRPKPEPGRVPPGLGRHVRGSDGSGAPGRALVRLIERAVQGCRRTSVSSSMPLAESGEADDCALVQSAVAAAPCPRSHPVPVSQRTRGGAGTCARTILCAQIPLAQALARAHVRGPERNTDRGPCMRP